MVSAPYGNRVPKTSAIPSLLVESDKNAKGINR